MPPRLSLTAPHATLRWVRADLLARRVQAIITVAVVAGVVAALLLAAMLLEGTTNPWQGLFARTHGADVMIRFGYGTDLAKLDALPGVTRVGTPSTGQVPRGGTYTRPHTPHRCPSSLRSASPRR